jgi:hypothetical protein
MLVWTYAENGRKYNSKTVLFMNLETTRLEVGQEIDGKMRRERMEE